MVRVEVMYEGMRERSQKVKNLKGKVNTVRVVTKVKAREGVNGGSRFN